MSVVGNEAGQGRPASGRRFERRQGGRSEIKRAAPPGDPAAIERRMRLGRPRARSSDVEVGDGQRVTFDEGAARFNLITHQGGENLVGGNRIFYTHLH